MATTRQTRLRALAVALALVLAGGTAAVASAADEQAFVIQDSRIANSSGLARDTASDLYWTVNDSGTQGTAYGLTAKGLVKGIVGWRADPKDVEAVAMYKRRLYVADIGDSKRTRSSVRVYYFDDPQPDNKTVPYRAYDFSYPDGAHDAETLLVDPDGRLLIVTKGAKGDQAGIYAAPERPSRQGTNELQRVASAPAYVTDGVFLPDGDRIALRTYVSVEVLDAKTYKSVARSATPFQRQGESMAVSLDGRSLLVGSEGKRSSVLRIAIPTTIGTAPVAGSTPPTSATTPTPSPSASDQAEDDPADDADAGTTTRRTGTILALALAALVAVVAGVVVGAVRRPGDKDQTGSQDLDPSSGPDETPDPAPTTEPADADSAQPGGPGRPD